MASTFYHIQIKSASISLVAIYTFFGNI